MEESLVKAMNDIDYNFGEKCKNDVLDNDVFHLESFLMEFSYKINDWDLLMKTLYGHDQTQYNTLSSIRIQDFIDRVISCEGKNNHALFCPIFSLKFKISVTIWETKKPSSTHHYSYCNINGVIKYDTCQGYQEQYVHNWGQILYITIGKSSTYGHYMSPTTESIAEILPPQFYNDSFSGQASNPHHSRVMYNHIGKLNMEYSPSNSTFRSLVFKCF